MGTSTAPPSTITRSTPGATRRWRRPPARRVLAWIACAGCLAVAALLVGLRVQPAPLPAPALVGAPSALTAVPAGLPAPVERFYRNLYGDRIPVIDTFAVSGRGTMRVQGITFPSRFRFSHRAGTAYRHYIETTVFGAPVLSVDERFIDGAARLELPFGVSEGPQVDQGANLALWAELVWAPAVWATSPAVRWEPVDATTARLVVPFGGTTEELTATFDADTGLLRRLQSLRYKGEGATSQTPWTNEVREWGRVDGQAVPLVTAVQWGDEDTAWAVLRTEDLVLDAEVTAYLRAKGP